MFLLTMSTVMLVFGACGYVVELGEDAVDEVGGGGGG